MINQLLVVTLNCVKNVFSLLWQCSASSTALTSLDMRPLFELCHCQWLWSFFNVISAIFSENCSLVFRSLIESPGDLMNGDIVDDLERPLKVILGTINCFTICISTVGLQVKHTQYRKSTMKRQWDIIMSNNFCFVFDCYMMLSWLLAIVEFLVKNFFRKN